MTMSMIYLKYLLTNYLVIITILYVFYIKKNVLFVIEIKNKYRVYDVKVNKVEWKCLTSQSTVKIKPQAFSCFSIAKLSQKYRVDKYINHID